MVATVNKFPFVVGKTYTRRDVFTVIGIPPETKGGNWDTGYARYADQWFIFCNVGAPGTTGHDYNNRFIGDELLWYGKTRSKQEHPSIQSMISPATCVHLFYRGNNRSSFTYAGEARAKNVTPASSPVEILWRFESDQPRVEILPEETDSHSSYVEGAVKLITVNAYERDPNARRLCVEHFGARCYVCDFDFENVFGSLGKGFIHVHHLVPLNEIKSEYTVDPIKDLRPVCPNCHAMLHRRRPVLPIEELRAIKASKNNG